MLELPFLLECVSILADDIIRMHELSSFQTSYGFPIQVCV